MRLASLFCYCLIAVGTSVNGAPLNADAYPRPGTLVQIDGQRFHLNCTGQGSPTVILDAGLGGTSLDWVRVQPTVSEFTRVCSYDRAGYGWSDRSAGPRTSSAIVDELYHLLNHGSISGPLVLVGHSFGGLTMRLFASRYPEMITGIVLVDSTHEAQFERFADANIDKLLVPKQHQTFVIANHFQVPTAMPEELRWTARMLALTPDAIRSRYSELRFMRLSAAQVREAVLGQPDVPLIVIAHDSKSRAKTVKAKRMAIEWMKMQHELAVRSSTGQLRVARNSGHYIHLEEPGLVIDAIREVVTLSREEDLLCITCDGC